MYLNNSLLLLMYLGSEQAFNALPLQTLFLRIWKDHHPILRVLRVGQNTKIFEKKGQTRVKH